VLACAPGLLLLDEPRRDSIRAAGAAWPPCWAAWAATIIVASHDLVFIQKVCARIIVLDGGLVAADGAAGEILGDGALLEKHGLA